MAATLQPRFWATVTKSAQPDGCWLRAGSLDKNGYVYVKVAQQTLKSHRFALEQAMGCAIPRGLMALHTCDTPACVRNDEQGTYVVRGESFPRWGHLWLGTNVANVHDMRDKRRGPEGATHGRAKLTDAQAREAYALRVAGQTLPQIAARYGVAPDSVGRLCNGQAWKHLELQPIRRSRWS